MAKAANSKNVERDESGPNYNATIKLIRGQLRSNDSDQRSLAQDNAEAYKRIEKDHGVHRGAAKQFAAIDKMAVEKRTDFLRSLLGLLGHAGYDNFDDLVDRAQRPAGKDSGSAAPKTPKPAPDATDGAGPEGKNGNISTADVDEEIERQRREDEVLFDGADKPTNVHPLPARQ